MGVRIAYFYYFICNQIWFIFYKLKQQMDSAKELRPQSQSLETPKYTFRSGDINKKSQRNLKGAQNQSSNKLTPFKWSQVAQIYCPEVLKQYPLKSFKQQYETNVYIIETQITLGQQIGEENSWKLFKGEDQISFFKDKIENVFNLDENKNKQQEAGGGFMGAILGGLKKSSKDQKGKQKNEEIFNNFFANLLPKDKYNLKLLSQYEVRLVQMGGIRNCLTNSVCSSCKRSNNFFITLTTENIMLSEEPLIDGSIEEAIPYNNYMSVQYKVQQLSHYKFTCKISSGRSVFNISFRKLTDLLKFAAVYNCIKIRSKYFQNHRFGSFCFERNNNLPKFYSDGEHYFQDLHNEIEIAEKKICITGWCITPYFLLKRPEDIQTGHSRLDHTLLRAAKRGVKIFIIVYQQPSLLINNDSYHVVDRFQRLHPNFKVLRHPGIIIPQLWSHHQKSVIIDEKVAFMGGLDICYGRWDNCKHSIQDYGNLWSGADYKNQRQKDITQPRNYTKCSLDKQTEPRMPWHDIDLQVRGPIVIDLQRHFVLYWYFALRDLSDDPRDHVRNYRQRYIQLKRQANLKNNEQRKQKQKQKERQELFGKSNPSPQQMAIIQYAYFLQKKDEPEKKDYTFSQRTKSASQAFKDLLQGKDATSARQIFIQGFGRTIKAGNFNMQLCRSSSKWSTGIQKTEHSIYNAYLALIDDAQELIYIENQFFMSYENQISERIAQRIRRAHSKKQKFKIVVVMPLMPGFPGDVTKESASVLRVQMQLQYQAIKRHQSSIYQLLSDVPGLNVEDYIGFFGLRQHGLFGKKGEKKTPQTQIIYVHSKMMIVDDKKIIIGSANINDRSLLGSRDSELAMIIEDPKGKVGSGQIFEFRAQIFNQHFGMSHSNASNIYSYWKKLSQIGHANALIYRQVFGCIPDNTCPNVGDVQKLQKKAKIEKYHESMPKLIGHYVQWPIDFLKNEDLNIKFGQLQFIAPITSFT